MLPELLDSNTFLLRDYAGYIKNTTDKLPNLTTKWTDFSISEPDVIFLNNIAYTNDLISYVIDYRYELTSVKYTQNQDFLNSICALTGSSVPFYRETYKIVINNKSLVNSLFIPKGTYLFDSYRTQVITTLKDVFALPNTENEVPVIVGYSYNNDLANIRNAKIRTKEPINQNSLYDFIGYGFLETNHSSAKVFYDFLLNTKESYWVTPGDNSLFVYSPVLEYLSYKFIGFATAQENTLVNGAEILSPNLEGSIFFYRQKEGNKPRDINDYKVAYLNSLSQIFTDINPTVFKSNLDYSQIPGIDRITLSYENNQETLISSSYISYTEGYIDFVGQIPVNTIITISYDYYNNDDNLANLKTKTIYKKIDIANSLTIDLELEENCTIKAFSTVIKVELPNGVVSLMTDYHNHIIVPRGSDYYRWFRYYIKEEDISYISGQSQNTPYFLQTAFIAGMVKQLEATETNKVYNYSVFIPTQKATKIYVYDLLDNEYKEFLLPNHNLTETIEVTARENSVIYIKDDKWKPLYRAYTKASTPWVLIDEERTVESEDLPNLVFHNDEKIYFLLPIANNQTDLTNQAITITLDQICSYQTQVFNLRGIGSNPPDIEHDRFYYTRFTRWADNNLGLTNLYYLILPQEYKNQEGQTIIPQEISLEVGGRLYYSNEENISAQNEYSSLCSSGILQNNIDLYDIPTTITSVKVRIIDVVATVYLKPLDLANSFIYDLIVEALRKYSDSLEIGERVSASALLATIIHSSEYIAYAELSSNTSKDADTSLSYKELKEIIHQVGRIDITFRNPDMIQF